MDSNREMVEHLKDKGRIKSEKVENAFLNIDRAEFIPGERKGKAYVDQPVQISEEATISAPHMVAIITELLDLNQNSRVLEIGSGSGYQAAILSEIAESVTGVEIDRELVERSRKVLGDYENIDILHGSGFEPVNGKFDRIVFSCGIREKMFEEARKYLEEDGVLVAPVGEKSSQILKKYGKGQTTQHGRVRFVGFIE